MTTIAPQTFVQALLIHSVQLLSRLFFGKTQSPATVVFMYTVAILVANTASANDQQISVNGKAMTPSQIEEYQKTYGILPAPGNYWYDRETGMFGFVGRPSAGSINPGHNFGLLPENASDGNTGVYINGRHLPKAELEFFKTLLGYISPGRYWMNSSGQWGLEKTLTQNTNR